MGKTNKHGLIEDRVIRNPMEQMRRKLKFKEKEKRKEQREHIRDQHIEQQQRVAHVDPLMQHDFSAVKQLKGEEVRRGLGISQEYSGKNSGVMSQFMPSQQRQQQEVHDVEQGQESEQQGMWQMLQNNYQKKQIGGEQIKQSHVFHEPKFRPQPYMKGQHQVGQTETGAEVVQSGAVLYKRKDDGPKPIPSVGPEIVKPVEVAKPVKQQFKKQQKDGHDFNDPLDPSHGGANYREIKKEEAKKQQQPKQQEQLDMYPTQPAGHFQNVSSDIRKALGLDKIQKPPVQQAIIQEEPSKIEESAPLPMTGSAPPRRFLPVALRKQLQTGEPLAKPQPIQKPVEQPKPIITIAEVKNPILGNLLGGYSSSDSDSEIAKPVQSDFKVPGQELMFAKPIIMDEDNKMSEELKRFMAELSNK